MRKNSAVLRKAGALMMVWALIVFFLPVGCISAEAKKPACQSIKIKNKKAVSKVWCGQSVKLKYRIKGKNKNVKFSSSKASVATVNNKGVITGVNPGTAKITVKSKANAKAFASVKIEVKAGGLTSLTFPYKSFTWEYGQEDDEEDTWEISREDDDGVCPFKPVVSPYKINVKNGTWESSDTTVATVSDKGTIAVVGYGKTTITFTYGDKSCSIKLTISEPKDSDDGDDGDDEYGDDDDNE